MALPSTTIVPFASLPSCAVKCGPLFDANGACVPPTNPSTDQQNWDSCFCAYSSLQPLKTGPSDICNGNCNSDPQALASIQGWFTSLCDKAVAQPTGTTSSSSAKNNGGGSWASTHVNWIVFIVVVVLAIIGIWIGACIWRRKYLKKKDRLHELGKGLRSNVAVDTQSPRDSPIQNGQGLFMSGPGGADPEQQEKRRNRWG
ncbi:hypothetical protein GGS21DRAFT_75875 [Xylaria nigripes]|nr:hypothetical protein GGS21DRAFT_75875 [Xylaria nigripes]